MFIELVKDDGKKIIVNVNNIAFIQGRSVPGSDIVLNGVKPGFQVKSSPQDIADKIRAAGLKVETIGTPNIPPL